MTAHDVVPVVLLTAAQLMFVVALWLGWQPRWAARCWDAMVDAISAIVGGAQRPR